MSGWESQLCRIPSQQWRCLGRAEPCHEVCFQKSGDHPPPQCRCGLLGHPEQSIKCLKCISAPLCPAISLGKMHRAGHRGWPSQLTGTSPLPFPTSYPPAANPTLTAPFPDRTQRAKELGRGQLKRQDTQWPLSRRPCFLSLGP